MSNPSANVATLTPVPVARFCAWGVLGSSNAVCVVCSASGSSSGLAGSAGHRVWPLGVVVPGAAARGAFAAALAAGSVIGPGSCTTVSGITCLTAASRAKALRSPAETFAANALSAWYCRYTRPPACLTCVTIRALPNFSARIRVPVLRLVAGIALYWFFRITITRDEVPRVAGSAFLTANPRCPPWANGPARCVARAIATPRPTRTNASNAVAPTSSGRRLSNRTFAPPYLRRKALYLPRSREPAGGHLIPRCRRRPNPQKSDGSEAQRRAAKDVVLGHLNRVEPEQLHRLVEDQRAGDDRGRPTGVQATDLFALGQR